MQLFADHLATPVGEIGFAVTSDGALVRVSFLAASSVADFELELRSDQDDVAWDPAPGARVRRQLEEYFRGERREFDLELAPRGTAFQEAVWSELLRIPFGHTQTYGELALRLGKPGGARAVGQASNKNPIAIVVPCHRCIGTGGKLTGFAGGLPVKQKLLDLERGQTAFEGLLFPPERTGPSEPTLT